MSTAATGAGAPGWRRRPAALAGSLLGAGYSPCAPGTCGTVAAAAPALGLWWLAPGVWWLWPALAVAFSALSYGVGREALRLSVGQDPRWFVLDEAAGFFLTLALIGAQSPLAILYAFLSFRVYDAVKPWPVSYFDSLPGSWGVLADDLAAAVPAAWTVWMLGLVLPHGWI
jgi:phosphatidylglycerophosphatase A